MIENSLTIIDSHSERNSFFLRPDCGFHRQSGPESRLFIACFRSRRGCTWLRYSSVHFTATCPNLIYPALFRDARHRLSIPGESTRPQGSLFYTCK